MIHALLHGKLGRPADDEESGNAHASAWDRLTAREDPLTSTIFERLAYLDAADAWALLRGACVPASGAEHPLPVAPGGRPSFRFWPKLAPGEGGLTPQRVEPDVLIEWGGQVLVVEAKHYGGQDAGQWVNEIRAVRADDRFAQRPLVFVAAGGADPAAFGLLVARVRREFAEVAVEFLLLRWSALREAAATMRPRFSPAGVAVVDDMIAALDAWGYRRLVGFDSLPAAAKPLATTTTPLVLQGWRL